MRRFLVEITSTYEVMVTVENEEVLVHALDWGYDTPDLVVEHLAYNYAFKHLDLSQIDGWADMDDKDVDMDMNYENHEFTTEELK